MYVDSAADPRCRRGGARPVGAPAGRWTCSSSSACPAGAPAAAPSPRPSSWPRAVRALPRRPAGRGRRLRRRARPRSATRPRCRRWRGYLADLRSVLVAVADDVAPGRGTHRHRRRIGLVRPGGRRARHRRPPADAPGWCCGRAATSPTTTGSTPAPDRRRAARGPALRPALRLWAQVLSVPEPGLAVAGFGRRDCSFDAGLPVPLDRLRRPGGPAAGRRTGGRPQRPARVPSARRATGRRRRACRSGSPTRAPPSTSGGWSRSSTTS